jgi:predicted ester cyclase
MTALPDLLVFLDDLILEGDSVVFHRTLNGTNTRPRFTGREVRISGFEFWQIGTEGLIATSLGHFDSDDYDRQLG